MFFRLRSPSLRLLVFATAFAGPLVSVVAKPAVPVRLVSFDPTMQKVGKADAQQATLELLEGRKAGKRVTVFLAPSQQTSGYVGKKLYLRLPLAWLEKRKSVFFAGELLDTDPAWMPPDFFHEVPVTPDAEGRLDAYLEGRIALDRLNEVNGTFLPPHDPARWMSGHDAIVTAERVHPNGVQGTFLLEVRGGAELQNGETWLNSEVDYKDPRSLNVGLPLNVAKDLALRLKADPVDFFKGRTIAVNGIAKRVGIETLKGGRPFTYYQTQVRVWSAHQIRLVR